MTQLSRQTSGTAPEATLHGEFDLDLALALAFVDGLLLNPPANVTVSEFVDLMAWRRGLSEAAPGANRGSTPGFPVRARTLVENACRQATQSNANWATGPGSNPGAASRPGIEKLPEEIWNALFAWTNVGGTISQSVLLLDSLVQSIPLSWRVKLQGGTWELYDANASARRLRQSGQAKVSAANEAARSRCQSEMAAVWSPSQRWCHSDSHTQCEDAR